jgi:hypothetical protein
MANRFQRRNKELGVCLAAGFLLLAALPARATETVATPADSSWRDLAPKLFVQDETYADLDYIKTEITFVNYVRDPKEADIHLTITFATTGGGGCEYTLSFQGEGSFKDIDFTLRHATNSDATPDESRNALVAAIKRGLAPFISRTRLRDYLSVEFTPPVASAAVTDPWKNWVFTLGAYGYPQGEKSWRRLYYNLNGCVSRVTENAKLSLATGMSVDDNRYVMDSSIVEAVKRSYGVEGSYARMLSGHFSLGGWADYTNKAYSNMRLGLSASPRLEYSITPYPEYARHKVYLRFRPEVQYACYYDTTLYDKLSELLFLNALQAGVTATRPWGTVDLSATGSHYLHDFSKNRLSLYGCVSLRILAGLSLNFVGQYDLVHDQLALRKGGASEEERLLRLRELATGYTYWVSLGLTYTFGSIYSNIVNPIF